MKTYHRLIATLAATVAAFSFNLAQASVENGKPAPDFSLTDIDGKAHKLSDFKGKIVVLEWHNADCPFVKKHYEKSGNLPATQKAATADGAIWLMINSGAAGKQGADYTADQTKEYLQKNGSAATAYLPDRDGKVGHLYGAKTTPHLYVINADGVLVYQGAIDSIRSADPADIAKATNYVNAALAAVKAGKPVEKATTEAYGCSVKY
ncbi:MAG: redoxin domain-containing protein [Verrucomicrobia bacterium]|nr:redoxin domain-containing protein [Verrucomicrobiota bacterium]